MRRLLQSTFYRRGTDKLPQLYLWEPDAYKDKVNSFTLYYGIVIVSFAYFK